MSPDQLDRRDFLKNAAATLDVGAVLAPASAIPSLPGPAIQAHGAVKPVVISD